MTVGLSTIAILGDLCGYTSSVNLRDMSSNTGVLYGDMLPLVSLELIAK